VPISGEEFTKGILRPLEESHLDFLAHQGFDIINPRLMARGMVLEEGEKGRAVLFSTPARREEYAGFRQRLLHLAVSMTVTDVSNVRTPIISIPKGG
jgi:hypothetical protein